MSFSCHVYLLFPVALTTQQLFKSEPEKIGCCLVLIHLRQLKIFIAYYFSSFSYERNILFL